MGFITAACIPVNTQRFFWMQHNEATRGKTLKGYLMNSVVAWKEAIANKNFRLKLILVPGLFFLYSAITQRLGNYVEARKGVRLNDVVLYLFPSHDYSFYIFMLLYSSIALLIITHLDKPKVWLRVIEMHFVVAIVRQACILLVALEPPAGLIVLRDIFLENTVYPPTAPLTKDLFFSGHVASIWIYMLCAQKNYLKVYLGFATVLMSFMLLSMRVHYSYDVYGAIFFTSLIFYIPGWVRSYRSSGEFSNYP